LSLVGGLGFKVAAVRFFYGHQESTLFSSISQTKYLFMNQMINLNHRLTALDREIKVGIIGIGSIGKGLVFQSYHTRGIRPVAIADIHIKKAIDCAEWLKLDYEVVDSVAELNRVIEKGKVAVTDNGELIAST